MTYLKKGAARHRRGERNDLGPDLSTTARSRPVGMTATRVGVAAQRAHRLRGSEAGCVAPGVPWRPPRSTKRTGPAREIFPSLNQWYCQERQRSAQPGSASRAPTQRVPAAEEGKCPALGHGRDDRDSWESGRPDLHRCPAILRGLLVNHQGPRTHSSGCAAPPIAKSHGSKIPNVGSLSYPSDAARRADNSRRPIPSGRARPARVAGAREELQLLKGEPADPVVAHVLDELSLQAPRRWCRARLQRRPPASTRGDCRVAAVPRASAPCDAPAQPPQRDACLATPVSASGTGSAGWPAV